MINQNNTNYRHSSSIEAPWLNRRIIMFPIWVFQCYLTLTVLVFAFGPWPWPVQSPVMLYTFLFLAQIALWLGYKSGIKTRPGSYYGRWQLFSMLKISLLVNLFWIIPSFMLKLGMQEANISNITTAVSTGAVDPGSMYAAKFEAASSGAKTTLFGYINILISPILWLLFPLGVDQWRSLNLKFRICFVFVILAGLLKWVAIGTTKGFADFFLLLPGLLLAANPRIIATTKLKTIIKAFCFTLVGFSLLFIVFIYMQQSRARGEIRDYIVAADIGIDTDNWMVRNLPPEAQVAVAASTSYLVQGYYGLSLALGETFDWSYGIGNSYFLIGLGERFVGEGVIIDRTYPGKIEKEYGWPAYHNWSSFYPWIASDVTFPGTLVVVFLIGSLFAKVWLDVLKKENPYAVPLFALLIMMVFYFPANNQVLAFPDTAPAFLGILICWVFTRKRYHLTH